MSILDPIAGPAVRWRSGIAAGVYAIAFPWFLGAVVLSLADLHRFTVLGQVISFSSWWPLRWPLYAACAAWLFDPHGDRRVAPLKSFLESRWRWIWPFALLAIAAGLVSFKVRQHLAFLTNGLDLMVFESALHHTLRGDFMWAFWLERSLFGDHFEPLLLALVPIYALVPSAQTLMVVQGLAVAAACIPLFRISRAASLSIATSSLLVLLFLSSRYLWSGFGFDFHVELFTPLLLFSAVLAFERRRWWLYYAALLGALCIKEDIGLALVSIALLIAFRRRSDWRHALATAALGMLWTAVAIKLVIPAFDVGARGQSFYLARYSHLGASQGEIALSLLSPRRVLGLLTGATVRELVTSLGLLPLLDPGLCLALVPPLLIHLASGFPEQALLQAHYALPGLSVALAGLPLALQRARRLHPRVGTVALVVAVCLFQSASWPPAWDPRTAIGRELLAQVPRDARVAAQNCLAAQLEPSKTLWLFPRDGADWVVLDLFGDHYPLGQEEYAARTIRLLEQREFGVVQWRAGFLVLRRGAPVDRNEAVLEEVRRALAGAITKGS